MNACCIIEVQEDARFRPSQDENLLVFSRRNLAKRRLFSFLQPHAHVAQSLSAVILYHDANTVAASDSDARQVKQDQSDDQQNNSRRRDRDFGEAVEKLCQKVSFLK